MSNVRNKVLIASATGAGNAILSVEDKATLYIIDGASIGSDVITIKLIDNDGATGAQAKFNGTSYQLDSSNNAISIAGPINVYIDKPSTSSAVGVGAYENNGD